MKFTTIVIGAAALVGLGFYLSRKFGEKNEEDESVIYTEENESYGEKLQKASLFAVGAIKTGADKIVEGFKDIRSQDMIKKGEDTLEQVKDTAGDIVEDLKDMVVSINVGGGEDELGDEDEVDDVGESGVSDDDIIDLNAGVAGDFSNISDFNAASDKTADSGFFMPNLPEDDEPFGDKF